MRGTLSPRVFYKYPPSSLLQEAQADIRCNSMAAAAGIELPAQSPLLHFSRHIKCLSGGPSTFSSQAEAAKSLPEELRPQYELRMTHAHLVKCAVDWLRQYGCGIVLSEQTCASGETPDAIGWKGASRSVVVECKVSRADFLADCEKPFRRDPKLGMGCERYYLTPARLLSAGELPLGWGLLLYRGRKVVVAQKSKRNQRSDAGFRCEMNLLLASLRRVEIRLGTQTITDFLKWKNRMAEYNGGRLPRGLPPESGEENPHLLTLAPAAE